MRHCPIFDWSLKTPHKTAILIGHATLSYFQFNQMVQSFCGYIKSLNLPKQSKFPFIATKSLETVSFFFAAWRMKMIACPLSFRLPQLALQHTLERLNAPLVVPQAGPIEAVCELDEELLATMLLTSGSTGQPKIACHRLSQHIISAENSIGCLNLEFDDHYLASLPFFHVGGIALLMRTFISGAALIISEDDCDKRASHLSLVPTQLYRILNEKPGFFNPKCILLGGAPIPSNLIKKSAGLNLYITYGMTEASSMITLNGKVLPHLELKIAEDKEILIRGQSIFEGYLNPDGTITSPLINNWLHTKDLGHFTEEGKLKFIGRKDRLFISGGENIQPEEIEEAIHSLFKVEQAIILPYQDEEFGMRPAAYLFDPEQMITLDSLQKELKRVLPGYKIPQKLFYLSHLYKKDEIKNLTAV